MSSEQTTILYFSGGLHHALGEFMRAHPEDFLQEGILVSYWNVRTENVIRKRMFVLVEENQK